MLAGNRTDDRATPRSVPTAPGSPLAGRDRLLDEAATLFRHRGYSATSLRTIAAASGMQAGSVYHHYASKDELLEAVLRRGIEVMVEAFDRARVEVDARGAIGLDRLRLHVRAHLGSLFEHGPFTAAHVTTFRFAPDEIRRAIIPVRDGYEALWTALLDDLVADGAIAPAPPVPLRRLMLMGIMNTTLDWFDTGGPQTLDDLADAITDQFWSGAAFDHPTPPEEP